MNHQGEFLESYLEDSNWPEWEKCLLRRVKNNSPLSHLRRAGSAKSLSLPLKGSVSILRQAGGNKFTTKAYMNSVILLKNLAQNTIVKALQPKHEKPELQQFCGLGLMYTHLLSVHSRQAHCLNYYYICNILLHSSLTMHKH